MAFCTKCGGANDGNAAFCRTCGAALPAAAAGGATPGAAAAPAPSVKKSNVGKIVMILVAIFIGVPVLAGVVVAIVMSSKAGSNTVDSGKSIDAQCDARAYEYLLALQQGKSAAATYWKPGATPETLFDVRSFNLIKHGNFVQPNGTPFKTPRVYYQYDVESTTKGGLPIRKRWDIVLEQDANDVNGLPCAIVKLVESQ